MNAIHFSLASGTLGAAFQICTTAHGRRADLPRDRHGLVLDHQPVCELALRARRRRGLVVLARRGGLRCRRSRASGARANAATAQTDARDVRCVERPEGCVWCEGRGGPTPPLVEPDAIPPSLCDPKDPGNCVDFCSRLAPECARALADGAELPARRPSRSSAASSSAATPPIARRRCVQGRVTDEAGQPRRGGEDPRLVPGDGHPRRGLGQGRQLPPAAARRALDLLGPRQPRRAGHRDRRPAHRSSRERHVRNFRLAPEIDHPRPRRQHGRASRSAASPSTPSAARTIWSTRRGAERRGRHVRASRGLDVKRYFLRASKFGWLPADAEVGGHGAGHADRLQAGAHRASSRGAVLDADGEGQANATVVALLSAGLARTPARRSSGRVDGDGKFAQDRFQPGTYYLWARRGEMLVYPPEKIEISDQDLDARSSCKPRPQGRARARAGHHARAGAARSRRARRAVRAVAAGAAAQGGGRDRPRRRLRGRRAAAGALRDLGARRDARSCRSPSGPREVEIPIEPGATVDLSETIVGPARRPRNEAASAATREIADGRQCRTRMPTEAVGEARGGSRSRTR